MEDLTEPVKAYLRDKLSSPYLFSCIATFVGINRKLVYGIFNFQESYSVDDRIQWIHNQLWDVKVFGLFPSGGFYGQIGYSIVGGFLVMFLADKLALLGKTTYVKIRRSTVDALQKLEPDKWVASINYEELKEVADDFKKKYDSIEIEAAGLRNKIKDFEGDFATLQKQYEMQKSKSQELENQSIRDNSRINFNRFELDQLKNKLEDEKVPTKGIKVILAIYGTDEKYKDITYTLNKLVDSRANRLSFVVSNDIDGDPAPDEPKKLHLWYFSNGRILKQFWNEGQKVDLT